MPEEDEGDGDPFHIKAGVRRDPFHSAVPNDPRATTAAGRRPRRDQASKGREVRRPDRQEAAGDGRALPQGSGQVPPPEPPEPAVVDEETLRRIAERKRFRETLAQEEMKARRAALFVQMARPEHLRALGIDRAMERVVSPERPRDENGAPVLSPKHPCSPLEKLGYFLKADQ
jgi:hypothetical protein